MINQPIALNRAYRSICLSRWSGIVCVLVLALLCSSAVTSAGSEEGLVLGVNENAQPGRAQSESTGEDVVGLPYSQILRSAQPGYEDTFQPLQLGGHYYEKIGSGDVSLGLGFLNSFRINLPFQRGGFQRENAQLAIGPFYFDLQSLSAALLYSDNVNWSQDNRKSGIIGIVTLIGAGMFQPTDHLRLAVRGALVYLPFRGDIGFAGFGIKEYTGVGYGMIPLSQARFNYDLRVAGWDIEVFDDLRASYRIFDVGMPERFFVNGETFDDEDRAGHYVFRSPIQGVGGNGTSSSINSDNRYNFNITEVVNTVGARASQLLPTVTRLEFGGYHDNYWYPNASTTAFLPHRRDTVFASLVSERETLRFKPFASYRMSQTDLQNGWDTSSRFGFRGPITQNLDLLAYGGHFTAADSPYETWIALVRLRHILNPLTFQQLQFFRGLTEPEESIENSISYSLFHVFRENLTGGFIGSLASYNEFRNSLRNGDEERATLRFSYHPALRMTWLLTSAYAHYGYNQTAMGITDEWFVRGEFLYLYSRFLDWRLLYQYRKRLSDIQGNSYYENMISLMVTKYF